jgi:hypothetical protein
MSIARTTTGTGLPVLDTQAVTGQLAAPALPRRQLDIPDFVTKRAFPYFSFIFLTKTLRRVTARVILPGTSEEPTRRCRLDNHLHNWLARPATLRLCQRRAPDRSNAYTIYRSARDPQNHFATIQNHRRPSAQTTLFAPLFSLGQYKTCTFVVRLFATIPP